MCIILNVYLRVENLTILGYFSILGTTCIFTHEVQNFAVIIIPNRECSQKNNCTFVIIIQYSAKFSRRKFFLQFSRIDLQPQKFCA